MIFDYKYIIEQKKYDPYLESAFFSAISLLGKPNSFLDIGCGTGILVRTAVQLGIQPAIGVDKSDAPRTANARLFELVVHNLNKPLFLNSKFDLVWCTEVGQFLPEEGADTFCRAVANHASRWVVFTSALPGRDTLNHINEQEHDYWTRKFEKLGLIWDDGMSGKLRAIWQWNTGPCDWLPEGLQVFRAMGS